jgi:hypothetical protein
LFSTIFATKRLSSVDDEKGDGDGDDDVDVDDDDDDDNCP